MIKTIIWIFVCLPWFAQADELTSKVTPTNLEKDSTTSTITNEKAIAEPSSLPDYSHLLRLYGRSQKDWPKIETADGRVAEEMKPLHLIGPLPNPDVTALGKKLFFDPILSRDKSVSCGSCHESRMHFGDKRRAAIGIDNQEGHRNTPNIFGIDHWRTFFWDGRASSAEEQALMPIENPIEMDLPIAEALERVNAEPNYTAFVQQAFATNKLTRSQMAKAIVAFERTIELPQTKYSRFLEQLSSEPTESIKAFSELELQGMHLFRTKAKCMTCHQGPLLSDNEFHVTGLHFYGRRFQDVGRFEVTKQVEDSGKFRTASLLFVSHTGPWMHNGLFSQFDGIVNFYNNGGARPRPREHVKGDPMFPTTTNLLPRLNLNSEEIDAVVAFLRTL